MQLKNTVITTLLTKIFDLLLFHWHTARGHNGSGPYSKSNNKLSAHTSTTKMCIKSKISLRIHILLVLQQLVSYERKDTTFFLRWTRIKVILKGQSWIVPNLFHNILKLHIYTPYSSWSQSLVCKRVVAAAGFEILKEQVLLDLFFFYSWVIPFSFKAVFQIFCLCSSM